MDINMGGIDSKASENMNIGTKFEICKPEHFIRNGLVPNLLAAPHEACDFWNKRRWYKYPCNKRTLGTP
jgi:hypothetical protein